MSRNQQDLDKALTEVNDLKKTFWSDVKVPGKSNTINSELEKAWRVSDFIELGEVMIHDASDRKESCGAHFREEYQTEDGEAMRNDEDYNYVSSWEYTGENTAPTLHKEILDFEVDMWEFV